MAGTCAVQAVTGGAASGGLGTLEHLGHIFTAPQAWCFADRLCSIPQAKFTALHCTALHCTELHGTALYFSTYF